MKWSIEERHPMAHEGGPDWIVEERSDRLVRARALEQEDGLGLGQEDCVSVESGLELLSAERRVHSEKPLRSLTTVGSQASGKDEAVHRGSLSLRAPRPERTAIPEDDLLAPP
jgi:hypothetical protein